MPPKLPPPPKVLDVLAKDVPEKIIDDAKENVGRIIELPATIDEDLATLILVIANQPDKIAESLYKLPGQAPENVDTLVDTIKEGFEYEGGSEEKRGERLRRITDAIEILPFQ